MKRIIVVVALIGSAFVGNAVQAQSKTAAQVEVVQPTDSAVFVVHGNCGMCKQRVEKGAKALEGVKSATWDVKTKELRVQYDASIVSEEAIQEKVAGVGHDTEAVKASDKVYSSLPGCCRYSRQ